MKTAISRIAVLVSSVFLVSHIPAQAAVPSTEVTVTGDVSQSLTLTSGDLQALPAVTQTDTFVAGTASQTHTYTGPTLWNVVNAAGVVTNPSVKNDILNKYVTVTGTDGYQTVFSAGELDPSFGNRAVLAAYAETINGVTAPLSSDGLVRVTSPGDVKGGRYVSNVANVDVETSASTVGASGGNPSTSFTVSGAVTQAQTFDLAALEALPSTQTTVGTTTYTGVSLWNLLSSFVGLSTNAAVKNDVLGMYVVATGSDGYKALFSLGEIDPAFGNQPDMIAYAANGSGLGTKGFARIVAPDDVLAGRYVSNLVSLEVFHVAAVPEPSTIILLLAGLIAIALRGRRGFRAGVRAEPVRSACA